MVLHLYQLPAIEGLPCSITRIGKYSGKWCDPFRTDRHRRKVKQVDIGADRCMHREVDRQIKGGRDMKKTITDMLQVTLNLSNNRLMNLPLDLGCLCCVEELFLQYNCLTKLPVYVLRYFHTVDHRQRTTVYISCVLQQSIGQMTRLYELDVKNNRLTELPGNIQIP